MQFSILQLEENIFRDTQEFLGKDAIFVVVAHRKPQGIEFNKNEA